LNTELSAAEVSSQLRALGVRRGGVLLVHTSFRAVRPIGGGPAGLIAALLDALGPEGTLVMPSWSALDDEPFDPRTTPSADDLGIVAQTFWRLPGVRRSNHFHAFAAVGPQADVVTADPLPLPPHIPASPVGRVHDLNGQVLLLGVGHSENTTLHLAELIASVPYRTESYVTVLEDGQRVRVRYGENNHCCARFALADEWLREAGRQSEGQVGHARARLADSRDIVALAVKRLVADPLLFLHAPEVDCAECVEARQSASLAEPIRNMG
jgi:aminoglycoside N3'-acetyltransferase